MHGEDPHHEDPYDLLEEHEETERLDEIAERHQQESDHFAHQVETVTRNLGEAVGGVEFLFEREALDRIVTDRTENQRIMIGVEEPDRRLDKVEARMDLLLSNLGAADRVRLRAEFMAEMFGIVSDGDARLYDRLMTLLVAAADGREIAGTDKLSGDLAKLLDTWQARDASDIWADLAARHPDGLADTAALAEEIGIIALVGELAPQDYVWLWENRAEIAERLEMVLGDRELIFPIDAAAIYDKIVELQIKFDMPLAVAAELAKYAFGAAGMEHGLIDAPELALDLPLIKESIARLDRVGDKLVFVVTGLTGERLVLKFEMPGSTETIVEFSRRFELTQDVARICLERLPGVERLADGELAELLSLGVEVEGATELLDMLNTKNGQPGLKDLSLILKMEHVNVGESLADMVKKRAVPKDLLSLDTLRDLGKLAMFDLLMGNEDRFHEEKSGRSKDTFVNLENIDFRLTDGRLVLVPLDNMSPVDVLSGGLNKFMALEFLAIGDPAKRRNYAQDVVAWLCAELDIAPPMNEIPGMQQEFLAGMTDTLTAIRNYLRRLDGGVGSHRSKILTELIKRLKAIT